MPPRTRDDESENGVDPPRHVHYHQIKNGGDRTNTILLAALIAIVGFVGVQVWVMNGRMSAFEATLNLLVQRSGIAAPPP